MSLSTYSCLEISLLVQMVSVHCVSQPLTTTDEGQWKMQTKQFVAESFITNQTWIKLEVFCLCCVYITLTLKESSSVWRTHSLFWKQLSCHGCLGALYPHYETRGTSGVSLFLLNLQGASVYHAPKYEPIFSIILWSPQLSVCSASPSTSPKTFCCFAPCCLFWYTISLESPWIA